MEEITVVDRLYEEFNAITGALGQAVQPSLCITANDCFRKALLLAAASHFERVITAAVLSYVEIGTKKNPVICEFVRKKGLSRQYHTLFKWDGKNANTFFALFGDTFASYAKQRVKDDSALDDSIRAFLELGEDRNRLVHEDFGNFTLEKTAAEIFELFKRAQIFADRVAVLLSECPLPDVEEHMASDTTVQ